MKNILALFLLISNTWAHELGLNTYLKMQKALARDDFKLALTIHNEKCEKELGHYKKVYKYCDNSFKGIKNLRDAFKSLSNLYIGNGKTKELNELVKIQCSMADAKWIQEKGEVQNPYFGKAMLTCGDKISSKIETNEKL
ncbi:MAG: DUF3347 domain-containing protein [Bacteriovoracaceae bacterium]|nr:DUF3347 domain-containing protein [Bacteriovoracaceae bacterium]